MMMNNQTEMNMLQLLALIQVLDMDIKHGMRNAFSITSKQALTNVGLLLPNERLTKGKKLHFFNMLSKVYDENKKLEDKEMSETITHMENEVSDLPIKKEV